MHSLNQLRLMAMLLVALSFMADCGLHYATRQAAWSQVAGGMLWGLVFTQVALLSVWLVFSAPRLVARLAFVLAATVVLAQPLVATSEIPVAQWLAVLAIHLALVTTIVYLLRRRGLQLTDPHDQPVLPATRRPRQFSTAQLFGWTTAMAVILALAWWLEFQWTASPTSIACAMLSLFVAATLILVVWHPAAAVNQWMLLLCLQAAVIGGFAWVGVPWSIGAAACVAQSILLGVSRWMLHTTKLQWTWTLAASHSCTMIFGEEALPTEPMRRALIRT